MATKKENVVIELQPINLGEATITIVGDTPLIVNCFDEKTKRQMLEAQMKKATKGKDPKNPVEDFMRSLHWITKMPEEYTEEAFEKAVKDGAKFGFPAVGIKASIVSSAYRGKLTKDKVSVNGSFHIIGELIEIQGTPTMREDMVRVANGMPDIRYRGEFKEWKMTFTIRYNKNVYSLEQLINFVNLGGFACGIGEHRTEKGGQNGSYHVA